MALGLLVAGGAAIGVRGLLVGMPPLDPVSFLAAAALLALVLLTACLQPAGRAAAADPATALRAE